MESTRKTEEDHLHDARAALLDAALVHVPFDGWSDQTLQLAVAESGIDADLARLAFPRGAVDLAVAFHKRGDALMAERMNAADLSAMRYSERIAAGVRFRLDVVEADKEAVRRGVSLFALPQHAGDGASALWSTSDLIWRTLGDTSRDLNWYTKRATLSAVYSSTVLFWLGDQSEGHAATWAFLDRRIDNVMQFEGFKAKLRGNPLFQRLMKGPGQILDRIHAPDDNVKGDLPGHLSDKK